MEENFVKDYQNLLKKIGTFNKTAEGYNYQYLELAPLLDTVMPIIESNNFVLIQTVINTGQNISRKTNNPIFNEIDKDKVKVKSLVCFEEKEFNCPLYALKSELIHTSGKSIVCEMPLYVDDIDPQAIGSSETYMRRYSIFALLHIRTQDDDGLAGSNKGKANKKQVESLPKLPDDINQIATFLAQSDNPKCYYRQIKESVNIPDELKRKLNKIMYPN